MRITSATIITIIFIINIHGSSLIMNSYSGVELLYFETIRIGHSCNHANNTDYIINTYDEWEDLWNISFSSHYPMPVLPSINFTENTIMATYFGEKPTSGYSIMIIGIVENDDQIIVNVAEVSPSGWTSTLQIVTHPYHIVRTEKIIKPVIFNHFVAYYIDPFTITLVSLFIICGICGIILYIRLKNKRIGRLIQKNSKRIKLERDLLKHGYDPKEMLGDNKENSNNKK
ncbi:MAG: protease complex subunit PrcB family protein [Promethearchaeota archaeon]